MGRHDKMTPGPPYSSIVATARNDDHGGNLLHRMQIFVSGPLEQSRRRQLKAELIVVEWNPPPDRPRLAGALAWPAASAHASQTEADYLQRGGLGPGAGRSHGDDPLRRPEAGMLKSGHAIGTWLHLRNAEVRRHCALSRPR